MTPAGYVANAKRAVGGLLPGIALVIALSAFARTSTVILPRAISEVTIGVVLGLVFANLLGVPTSMKPGVKFAVGVPLRMGIVLLGSRLNLGDVFETGMDALLLIVVCMIFAFGLVFGAGRVLGLPPRLTTLIAVGTAVCGNSAIIATAPVIEAEERDVSFAVATITLFGTLAVLVYPLIGHALGFTDRFFGFWTGVAVNDTSQVTATSFAFSPLAGETATIVKLTRNTLMAPLIVLIGTVYLRSRTPPENDQDDPAGPRRHIRLVPSFVLGFVAMAAINSLGIIPNPVTSLFDGASTALILGALVAVGLTTNSRQIREIGYRPLYLGLVASMTLSLFALGLGTLVLGS